MSETKEPNVILCMPDDMGGSFFDDDKRGPCSKCGTPCHWRPHMPEGEVLCVRCGSKVITPQDEIVATPQVLAELSSFLQAQGIASLIEVHAVMDERGKMDRNVGKRKTMRMEWESYRERIVPAGAGPTQVVETERAFYAGAIAYRYLYRSRLDMGTADCSEEEARACQRLDEELNDYVETVQKSRR